MKKLSLVVIGALGFFTASMAQSQSVQVGGTTFGVRAGLNLQNINGRDAGDDKLENKLVPRFHVGVNAEIPVAPEFYVQPGILFSTKGTKFENGAGDPTLNLSYIEVPINVLYKPVVGNGKLLVGFGPYVAYGIGGKYKTDGDDTKVKFKGKVKSGDDPNVVYFKPFDAGANLLFGYEFSNRFSAQLNAQLGLVNINSDYDLIPDTDARSANTGFGVSVGYRF
ncbi:MAG: PorT family protein [Chitinophagaceae bacterium]|nr:MAG: PorT family protein [Chitinophagaceae bacterium]